MSKKDEKIDFDIPESFECMAQKCTVRIKKLHPDKAGQYDTETGKIDIAPAPHQYQVVTFWHEYFHAAFTNLGYEELNRNEQLIDQLAGVMTQFFKTRKG